MVRNSLHAALAAERVGYASPSQFSREFKRLFGVPPAEEAERVRFAFGFTDQVSAAQQGSVSTSEISGSIMLNN